MIARLGELPQKFKAVQYSASKPAIQAKAVERKPAVKKLVGVDVFLDYRAGSPDDLAAQLAQAQTENAKLDMITNRGVKVWPNGAPETFCTDHWRCRFLLPENAGATHEQLIALMGRVHAAGLDFIKTENLYTFDGVPGYSLGQGQ